MIKLVDDDNKNDFLSFCNYDVFGTRIKAYFLCYKTEYDFVHFWCQFDGMGSVTATIGRIDGDMTLCAYNNCDCDELAEFISVVGYRSLQCEALIAEKMKLIPQTQGYVVRYNGNGYIPKSIELKENFELKEIYSIIKTANLIGVGEYLPWLSDTSFRINHGVSRVAAAQVDKKIAGCAMILFETDCAALLGAVATYSQFRGRGIAGALVTSLAKEAVKNNKRAELLCKNDSIVDFYKSIGFEVINEWSIVLNETELF